MSMFVLAILIHVVVYWRECRLSFYQGGKEAWWKNYTCALLLMWSPCIRFAYKPLVQGDLCSSLWSVSGRDAAARVRACLHRLGLRFSQPFVFSGSCLSLWETHAGSANYVIMRLCGRSYALLRSSVWSLFAEESSQYGEIFCEWTLVSPLIICAGQPHWSRVCFGFVAFRLLSQGEVCTTGTLCCSLWVHEAAHAGDGWQPSAHVVDHEAMMGMLCDLCRVYLLDAFVSDPLCYFRQADYCVYLFSRSKWGSFVRSTHDCA